jgi:hypothetical protein
MPPVFALLQSSTNFWRAIAEPAMVSGLEKTRTAEEAQALVDLLMVKTEESCLADVTPLSFVTSRLMMKRK